MTDDWPSYSIGPRDSIFAIGVVSTKFTELESALRFIFATVFGINPDDSTMIFAKIGIEATVELTSRRLAQTEWPGEAQDHVRHFLKAFNVCKENRDGLMHSGLAWAGMTDQNVLIKQTKKGTTQLAVPTIKEMRAVADDISRYIDYGRALGNAINNQHVSGVAGVPVFPTSAFPWPDKPPLPRSLGYASDPLPL